MIFEVNNDIVSLTISDAIQYLATAYTSLIHENIPFKCFPSVMLWGAPGVGKSQGIRQLAGIISNETGKKVCITDVRLLLFNPVDLRGIPTANADRTLAVWLKPQIFQMQESDDIVNILFLDELSAAPQSVQAAAYQITLDRMIGEHKLPENCIVIAAGNRVTDKSVAYNMPKALANRLCHLEIRSEINSWHDWAVKTGVNDKVIGYLDYNPAVLSKSNVSTAGLAFATPRSWEMVSNILNHICPSVEQVFPLIAGCIGYDMASSLKTWEELYNGMPDMKLIFSGQCSDVPQKKELQLALVSAMVAYARTHFSKKEIDSSIEYACRLPWIMRGNLLHDYYLLNHLHLALKDNEVFHKWLKYVHKELPPC